MANTELKLFGDNCFRNFKFEKAIEYYEKGSAKEGADLVVLNSNISACYFELGNFIFWFILF